MPKMVQISCAEILRTILYCHEMYIALLTVRLLAKYMNHSAQKHRLNYQQPYARSHRPHAASHNKSGKNCCSGLINIKLDQV